MLSLKLYYILHTIIIITILPFLLLFTILLKLLRIIKKETTVKSIKDQVAVITGSAGGLGRLLAIELAKRGCHVAIVDIQQDLAEKTANFIAEKYQVKAKSYKVDVSDYKQLEELNINVTQDLGDVTILINNAAMIIPSKILDITFSEIQNMINVNFAAICFAHKIFLPKMKELNRGHIVNISSVSALFNSHIFGIYGATKAAVRSLSTALRINLKCENKNIGITTVMPYFMNTHKQVEVIFKNTGYNKFLPTVEGTETAKYILDGVLNNDSEITVPYLLLYYHKLFEIFPISIRDFMMSIFSSTFFKAITENCNGECN